MEYLVINGVNLNMLGSRQVDVYGQLTLAQIEDKIKKYCSENAHTVEFFTSNIEGEICTAIQNCKAQGIVLNAGAYSHYSIAIRDAIASIKVPVVEVHLSNIYAREEFRHKSVLSAVCKGCVVGFKEKSYILAIKALEE